MSAADSSQPAASKKSSGAATRLLVLMAVLVLALGALAYDWKVARPQSEAAYHQIMELSQQRNSKVGFDLTTNKDVQELLGKMPVKTEPLNGKMVEHYRWWGGFPGRSYKVYVEYDQGDGRLLLSAAHLNELPPPPAKAEAGPDSGDPPAETMAAGVPGAPGSGGPGPGGPGRGEGRGEGRGGRPEGRPSGEEEAATAENAGDENAAPATEEGDAKESDAKESDSAEEKPAEASDAPAAEKSPEESAEPASAESDTPAESEKPAEAKDGEAEASAADSDSAEAAKEE